MRGVSSIVLGLLSLTLVVSAGHASPPARVDAAQQQATIDAVLAAYQGGDTGVIARSFARPRDFQDRFRFDDKRELERWLGSWDRGKAVLLLEIARSASGIAPRYTPILVSAGRGYLGRASAGDLASTDAAAFVQLWHRTAVGLLQGFGDPGRVEEHVGDADRRADGHSSTARLDARLVLARATAQERRCWDARPALDQPGTSIDAVIKAAGVTIADDPNGPTKAAREAGVRTQGTCLHEALARFETAAGTDETHAEARVRGGWILFQQGRLPEALVSLDAAEPRDDRDLAYWLALFRGRVFDALGRSDDAAAAYQSAMALYPAAQSAGTGLALELVRLDRAPEADQVARGLRAAGASAPDPWSIYIDADRRFVDRWIEQLRKAIR